MIKYLKKLLRLLSKDKQTYEYFVLSVYSVNVKEEVSRWQNNGWEVAGTVSTFFEDGCKGALIPLRRKIKKKAH